MTVFLLFLCFFGTGIGLLAVLYGTVHNKKRGHLCRYGHGAFHDTVSNRTSPVRVVVMIRQWHTTT